MKNYSIILCTATGLKPEDTAARGNTDFRRLEEDVLQKYVSGFRIKNLVTEEYQNKFYGWKSFINPDTSQILILLFIDPKSNLPIIKSVYNKLLPFVEHGYTFNVSNLNQNLDTVSKIFKLVPQSDEEFYAGLGATVHL